MLNGIGMEILTFTALYLPSLGRAFLDDQMAASLTRFGARFCGLVIVFVKGTTFAANEYMLWMASGFRKQVGWE